MAVDAAMLDHAEQTGDTLIRLYRWAPHCLSFGRHEPARRRYDRARIAALGIDCVRRPTGGRAVWHARELTYSVAGPADSLGDLTVAYTTIHEWLASSVRRVGAPAVLAPKRAAPSVASGPCFAVAVGGEVLVDGRKVVGSAQRRGERALLQHGSMLLEDDQSLVRSLALGFDPEASQPEAALSTLLGRRVTFNEAAGAIQAELRDRGFDEADPKTPNDIGRAAGLHFEQYQSEQWTWER